jgi:hypothetical protein
LLAVFLEWMEPLRKCIDPNGESVESSKINVSERLTFIHTLVRCSCMRGTPWNADGRLAEKTEVLRGATNIPES